MIRRSIFDETNEAIVKVLHCIDHVSYWTIDIPPDVDEFIQENANLTVSQVSIPNVPKPSFKRKSIYQRWAAIDRKQWRRDDDEIKYGPAPRIA